MNIQLSLLDEKNSHRVFKDEVSYTRNTLFNRQYQPSKKIHYEALFIQPSDDIKELLSFKSKFSQLELIPEGIDKIELTINQNFVNEDNSMIRHLSSGAVTLRKNGEYLHILIHREALHSEQNILSQIEEIIQTLILRELFKIPTRKIVESIATGEILSIEDFTEYEHIENVDEFFACIMGNLSISNFEIFYDSESKDILDLLNDDDFYRFKTTLYSRDYKCYSNGSRKKSLVCIYDKRQQLREVKHSVYDKERIRIEFRINKNFSRKLMSTLSLFDGDFHDLLKMIEKQLVKKLKKLDIGFKNLYGSSLVCGSLRNILGAVLGYSNNTEEGEDNKEEPDDKNCEKVEAFSVGYNFELCKLLVRNRFWCAIKSFSRRPMHLYPILIRGP